MEEIETNVDNVKPVGPRPPTNRTSPGGSDRRFLGAVVLFLGLLSFFLLAALIGLGFHLCDSAAEHLAVRDDLTERLQAAENKTSSQSEEIERLQTLTKQIRDSAQRSAAEHLAVRDDLTERLQAAENKTSSQSEEIERLQTLTQQIRDSAAKHLAVRDDLTERLQAAENKTSSQSEEIERLQTLTKQMATCPAGWKKFDSTCYFVSAKKDSWENGWKDCKSLGADLAIIERAEEQKFLSSIIKQDTWIGLTDRDQEGTWKWSDGTPFTLAFWRTEQPDNGGGDPQYGEEDCATISANRGPEGNWNDLRCDASMSWICEKKLI